MTIVWEPSRSFHFRVRQCAPIWKGVKMEVDVRPSRSIPDMFYRKGPRQLTTRQCQECWFFPTHRKRVYCSCTSAHNVIVETLG
jgi:hypothetical protein